MKKVMIGCDPEFMILTNNQKVLPANEICDDYRTSNHFGREIGQNGFVFELRPDPSTNVFAILANIRKILRTHIQNSTYLKNCIFVSGHAVKIAPAHFAIGGHIHISGENGYDTKDLLRHDFRQFINKIIYSGFMYIINDKNGHELRQKIGYGKRRDFRDKEHTAEYRSPPSWLVSPTLAFMFLTIAKICGLLFINRGIWDIEQDINDLLSTKCRGFCLLRKLITLVKTQKKLMEEEDVIKCLEILNNLPNKRINLVWQRDFKSSWEL
jgi:hypothetical protein